MDSYKKEINQSLISCILSRQNGVPLSELNDDFKELTGYSIPYLSLGHSSLMSYLTEIKNLYFIKDEFNEDTIIADSKNSYYMQKLIEKQVPRPRKRKRISFGRESPELDVTFSSNASTYFSKSTYTSNKKRRKETPFISKQTMETLTPILYGNQLLGDDVFLKMAEKHLMVNITETAPRRCGLCISGQTILDLIENLKQQNFVPSQVTILIGLADILNDQSVGELIKNMKLLVDELRYCGISGTICTIPELSCIPKSYSSTLKKFNDYIISIEEETDLIKVFHLNEYYSCFHRFLSTPNKEENAIVLAGLQDYLKYSKREE